MSNIFSGRKGEELVNKIEFIEGLRKALEMRVSPQTAQENITYYSQYIDDETRKGRREGEVVGELGDPWVIAKTIIDTQGTQEGMESTHYESPYQKRGNQKSTGNGTRVFLFDVWWKRLLFIVCVLGVIAIAIAVITGIISLVAPVVIPVLCVVMVIRYLSNRQ